MKCIRCKNKITANTKFCTNCGNDLSSQRISKCISIIFGSIALAIILLGALFIIFMIYPKFPMFYKVKGYLEKKYDIKCSNVDVWGDSTAFSKNRWVVSCKGLEDSVFVKKNYQSKLLDNYIAVKYKKEMLNLLEENIYAQFSSANVFYEVSKMVLSDSIDKNISFEDYIKQSDATITFTVEVKSASYYSEDQILSVAQQLNDIGLKYYFLIVIINDEEYGKYNENQLHEKASFFDFEKSAIITNVNNEVKIHWVEEEIDQPV